MNSKSIFKKILPILIALVIILIAGIVGAVIASDKKVPGFSNKAYGEETFITYTTEDGTEIKLSRNQVYNALRGTSSSESVITDTTVQEIVNIIDKDLLADYVAKVKEQDVYDLIAKQIFSSTFDSYIKTNKDTFKVEAHKEGKSYKQYLNEKIEEAIETYIETLKYGYGISATKDDFSWKDSSNEYYYVKENDEYKLDEDGEKIYQMKVSTTTGVYEYYALEAARTDYAKEIIKTEYEEDFKEYIQYLADLEAYNNYLEAVSDYEEALADWKNTKQGSKPKKSDYYTKKVEKPEEVEEPLSGALDEDAFKDLYEDENYKEFWSIIVSYESQAKAEAALLQYGVVIAENASGDNRWFHYGVTDYEKATTEQKAIIAGYDFTTKGDTTIITDDDYYNLLTTDQELYDKDAAKTSSEKTGLVLATKANPDSRTGAYELTEAEVKDIIVKLYNQAYQYDTNKQLTTADYDKDATYDENSKLYYTESELTTLGLYSSGTSSNKFYKFSSESTFEKAETYTNTIISSNSKYFIYLIVDKKDVETDWEDYLNDKEYYETEFYTAHKDELLEDQATSTYVKTTVSKLRYESSLIIYDETLETNYMNNYTSDYKATKKSSKTLVASYVKNGEKKEVSVDQIWEKLAPYYGVYSTVDLVQYEWVFLEACDASGNKFNKYVDYNKYLSGKKLSKCIYDTDEAKELYDNVSTYVENVKYYFSIGSYESYGYGSDYGWKNFIRDYYATYYNVTLTTNDDLKLFFINQQIITDYSNYIAKVDSENWANAYLTYAGKTLSNYINTTGVHLLISIPDVEKNEENDSTSYFVDPTNWTDEQLAAAEELYDKVLGLLEIVDENEISTVLSAVVSAFDDAPLPLTDGSKPNISYNKKAMDDSVITNDYLSYEYKYYGDGNATPIYTIDVSKYKAMGFDLTTEDLTITQGTMVSEFEEAVRQIWNSQLADLVTKATVSDVVIYDHSFTAPEYKNYDEDTNTVEVVNNNGTNTYLTTTYGLHVYVNQSSDLSAYFTTNSDNDNVFVSIPDIKYVQMYVYDKLESSDNEYIALATLYSNYEEAKEDNDTFRLNQVKENIEKAKEKLGFDMTFDEFYALLSEYAGDNASYVSTQISTWVTVYTEATSSSSASYSMAFGDYISSSYYHLNYVQDLIAKLASNKVKFADEGYSDKYSEYINYFISNYYDAFSAINFLDGDKEATEDLLDALACINGTSAYSNVAQSAIDALKTFAQNAYNNLTAEEKAELADAYAKAGF